MKTYIVNSVEHHSLLSAALANGVTQDTITRWCHGRNRGDWSVPPRAGCSVIEREEQPVAAGQRTPRQWVIHCARRVRELQQEVPNSTYEAMRARELIYQYRRLGEQWKSRIRSKAA
jgi:hypothetical protein